MKPITLPLTTALLLMSSIASADTWSIYQKTNLQGALFNTLHQKNSTSGSVQGINVVTTDGDVNSHQHTLTPTATFLLQQTDTVSGSTQAVNHVKTGTGVSSYSNQAISANNLILSQTTSGTNVVQGGNMVDASTGAISVTTGVNQTLINQQMTLNQQGTQLALQAGNGALTSNSGGIALNGAFQGVSLYQMSISQGAADHSIQAANYLGSAQ